MTWGPGTPNGPRPPTLYQPTCRSCGAPIQWLRTRSGRTMPVDDPHRSVDRSALFDNRVHVAHFATCPNADHHRRKEPKA